MHAEIILFLSISVKPSSNYSYHCTENILTIWPSQEIQKMCSTLYEISQCKDVMMYGQKLMYFYSISTKF